MRDTNPKPYASLASIAFLFAAAYTFAELLRSSGSRFLLGGNAADWAQMAAGAGAYWLSMFVSAAVAWRLLRVVARGPWVPSYGVTAAAAVAAWALMKLLHTLARDASINGELAVLGAVAVSGLLLAFLQWRPIVSPRVFCAVWGVASLSGIAVLYNASRLYFLEPQRPVLAGTLAVTGVALAGVFGTVAAVIAQVRRTPPLLQVLLAVLAGCLLPAALMAARMAPPQGQGPPGKQMVFVTCDALRADCCSAYGGHTPTPNMESLAEQGLVFDRCYAVAPWTLPSMCGMFASKYPPSMTPGATDEQWGEVLGPHGKVAAYWLDSDGRSQFERMGEKNVLTAAFLANPLLTSERWLLRGFKKSLVLGYSEPEARGMFWRFPTLHASLGRLFPSIARERPIDTTRILTQYAKEFVRRHAGDGFFLWIHYMDPHDPYDPPARFRTSDGDWDVFSPIDGAFGSIHVDAVRDGSLNQAQHAYIRSLYEGEIRYVDEAIGQLRRALETHAPDAALCVTADHGEELWDHGAWGHGQSLYDEQLCVPLIFWGNGVAPGRVTQSVSGVDVLPTVARFMGFPARAGWRGESLAPFLRGKKNGPVERPCFSQGTRATDHPLRSVVADGYKLVKNLATGSAMLFDLETGPEEEKDLSGKETAKAEDLRQLIAEWAGTFPSMIADFEHGEMDEEIKQEAVDNLKSQGYL